MHVKAWTGPARGSIRRKSIYGGMPRSMAAQAVRVEMSS